MSRRTINPLAPAITGAALFLTFITARVTASSDGKSLLTNEQLAALFVTLTLAFNLATGCNTNCAARPAQRRLRGDTDSDIVRGHAHGDRTTTLRR